jgi:antitoxin (DNA-binding transcriptional repressor) of toxin-antitoxin stability system
MNPTAQIIGIKQLHKDMKKISEFVAKGQVYIVVKNSKPAFKIVPMESEKSGLSFKEAFKNSHFTSDNPNLSMEIDKILYGSDS